VITDDMLMCRRPATGIAPRDWQRVVGLRMSRDIKAGSVLQWGLLQQDQTGVSAAAEK
ncbi:MAG: hypothetical protein EON92_19940, partial [Burkholderiales bacterium]